MRCFVAFCSTACLLCLCLCAQYSDAERNTKISSIMTNDISQLPAEDLEWLLQQGVVGKDFWKKMGKVDTTKISHRLKQISSLIKKTSDFGERPEHKHKNIFRAPYDETRTLRHIPGFYISASDVLMPKQAYIVGEEPTKQMLPVFWETILEAGVETIVALSTPPGWRYYQDSCYPLMVRGWTIAKITEEEIAHSPFLPEQRTVKRTFLAIKKGEKKRFISHLHFENWPDHQAAEGALFHHFLQYVEYLNPNGAIPIFVHCAAGVGRSGTFVAAHSLYRELSAAPSHREIVINIPMQIMIMRMQRRNLLSRSSQLQGVVTAIRERVQP